MATEKSYLQKKKKTIMPFGKYSGEYVEDLPKDYISYMANRVWFQLEYPDLYDEFNKILEEDE